VTKRKNKRKVGLPPGSLVYTGELTAQSSDIIVVQYNKESITETFMEGRKCMSVKEGFVTWYDMRGLSDVGLVQIVGEHFHMHALAIEDVLNTQQRPKWEDYKNGIYLVVRAVRLDTHKLEIVPEQISFFLGKDFLLSFQEDNDDLFPEIRLRLAQKQGLIREKSADYLLYALLDYITDQYFVILDTIEEHLDKLEDSILYQFHNSQRSRIYQLKRLSNEVRRALLPMRELAARFVRDDSGFVSASMNIFTRDLFDHITQAAEMAENQKETLNNLHELFNAEQANRANHVMKVLTIVSSIFIPLTFIVGVYGMNFDIMPELRLHFGYPTVWAIMALIAGVQLIYFKRKGWL
jgi:magnesium transporter